MKVPQTQDSGLRVLGRVRSFYSSSACPAEHFLEQQIIFDLTFCGQWAGRDFEVAMGGKVIFTPGIFVWGIADGTYRGA